MAMTLDDVTVEIMESNEKLDIIKNNTAETNEYLLLTIDTLSDRLTQLNTFFEDKSLTDLEDKKEENQFNKKLLKLLENLSPQAQADVKTADDFLNALAKLKFFLGSVAVGAAALAGAFASYLERVKNLSIAFKNLLTRITPSNIASKFTKAFDAVADVLRTRLGTAGTTIGKAIDGIVSFFKGVGNFFKTSIFKIPGVKGVVDTINRAVKAMALVIANTKKVTTTISKIGKRLSAFRTVFGTIFSFVSKIFAPLYTLYTTVKGVYDGYQKDGLVGAIKGGITGFFAGFIGDFLNIISSAASWIAEKFGFDKVSAQLDKLDFNKLFSDFVDGVFKFGTDVINYVKGLFGFGEDDPDVQASTKTINDTVKKVLNYPFVLAKDAVNSVLSLFKSDEKEGENPNRITLKSLIENVIFAPYKLVQKVLGAVLGLLGYDQIKEDVENFSFVDFFTDIIDKILATIGEFGDWLSEKFSFATIKESLPNIVPDADMAEKFLKEAIRSILPKPDEEGGFFSIRNIASSAIPDSVYEYAGMNPDTGELIEPPEQKKAEMLGAEAQASEIEKQMMQMSTAPASGGGNITVVDSSNKSTNTVNEFKPAPNAVRPPNSPTDVFYGADVSNPG